MKFAIRRFIFGVILSPVVVAVYAIAYGLLSLVVEQPLFPPVDVMLTIGIMTVLCLVFAKQIAKLVSFFID
jgi:hypothetical protein